MLREVGQPEPGKTQHVAPLLSLQAQHVNMELLLGESLGFRPGEIIGSLVPSQNRLCGSHHSHPAGQPCPVTDMWGGAHTWIPFAYAPFSSIKPPAFLSSSFLQLLLPHVISLIK